MTPEEAATIAGILTTADGGCGPCFDDLSKRMSKEFPEYNWWALGKEAEPRFAKYDDAEDEE